MVYLVFETNAPTWAIATCSGIAFVLFGINAIFVGICFSSGWLEGIISRLIEFVEKVFHRRVDRSLCIGIVRRFHSAMNGFTEHRWTIIVSSAWAFAAWLCMNLVAFVTFKSMGIEVSMWAIFAVYAVMIFIQMLPLVLPGGIGLVDIVMITLFSAIGVSTSYAVAATILQTDTALVPHDRGWRCDRVPSEENRQNITAQDETRRLKSPDDHIRSQWPIRASQDALPSRSCP